MFWNSILCSKTSETAGSLRSAITAPSVPSLDLDNPRWPVIYSDKALTVIRFGGESPSKSKDLHRRTGTPLRSGKVHRSQNPIPTDHFGELFSWQCPPLCPPALPVPSRPSSRAGTPSVLPPPSTPATPATSTSPPSSSRHHLAELHRKSVYNQHRRLLTEYLEALSEDCDAREAKRGLVHESVQKRPERERRKARVNKWSVVVFAAAPLYEWIRRAVRAKAEMVLHQRFAALWRRRYQLRKLSLRRSQALHALSAALAARPLSAAKLAQHSPFFAAVPPPHLVEALRKFTPWLLFEGEKAFFEGDPPDYFYIIAEGTASVTAMRPTRTSKRRCPSNCVELARLSAGDFFGEAALLLGISRTATVTAVGSTLVLWRIPQAEFVKLWGSDSTVSVAMREVSDARRTAGIPLLHGLNPETLRRLGMFAEWLDSQLAELIAQFQPAVAHRGEVLIREKEPPTAMFYIASGSVEVYTETPSFKTLATLGPGRIFGEVGCLFMEPRCASVRCAAECELWVISKDALRGVLLGNALAFQTSKDAVLALRARWVARLSPKVVHGAEFFRVKYPNRAVRQKMIAELLVSITPRVMVPPELFCEKGTRVPAIFFVIRGLLQSPLTQLTYSEGAVLGAAELETTGLWLDTLQAVTPVEVWVLSKRSLKHLFEQFPPHLPASPSVREEVLDRSAGKVRGAEKPPTPEDIARLKFMHRLSEA
eukprot:RCo041728